MLQGLIKVILAGCAVKSLLDNSKDVRKMTAEEKLRFFESRKQVSNVRNACYLIKNL